MEGMMEGLGLLRVLIESTGLPPVSVELEMRRLIEKHGFSLDTLSLEQVRIILADYLQDALLEAKADTLQTR